MKMPYITRPNSWVSQDTAATAQLTYGLQLNPAPLTVSISGRDPILGSLEFVITNPTSSAIALNSVAFTIQVGSTGSNLTTTTANVGTSVSDITDWQIQSPGTVTSGPAVYTLSPQTGQSVSVAPGASIIVEIYNFPTVENPGNTTITVKETAGTIGFTSFLVTTFPSGFYFNGLSATVENGSQLVPAAQVATGAPVTLVWNSSVVDLASFTIYYSNAAQGQQSATPTDTGLWTSGPLTADTVFTIVVTVSISGGSPLTAALSTAVSVQNPSLIAASITAGTATVNGLLTVTGATQANAITATGLTVNGATSTGDLTSSGTLTVPGQSNLGAVGVGGNLNVTGNGTLGSANVSGALQAGSLSAGNASLGYTTVNGLNASGGASMSGYLNLCPAPDTSQGTVGIGGTVSGNVMLYLSNSVANNYGIYVNSAASSNNYWALCVLGPCINTSGSWSQISDLTLKSGIEPFNDSLAQVLKINPIRYRFKEGLGLGTGEHIGVAAQDLQKIAPYMVGTGKLKPDSDEAYLTIDNGAMTYMLINAVKELHAEIVALKAELKTRKGK
jgi:hypothetical protein